MSTGNWQERSKVVKTVIIYEYIIIAFTTFNRSRQLPALFRSAIEQNEGYT